MRDVFDHTTKRILFFYVNCRKKSGLSFEDKNFNVTTFRAHKVARLVALFRLGETQFNNPCVSHRFVFQHFFIMVFLTFGFCWHTAALHYDHFSHYLSENYIYNPALVATISLQFWILWPPPLIIQAIFWNSPQVIFFQIYIPLMGWHY